MRWKFDEEGFRRDVEEIIADLRVRRHADSREAMANVEDYDDPMGDRSVWQRYWIRNR